MNVEFFVDVSNKSHPIFMNVFFGLKSNDGHELDFVRNFRNTVGNFKKGLAPME